MAGIDVEQLKDTVCARVDELAPALIDASHQIHAHPELNFEEHFAHGLLTDLLEANGVAPVRGAYGLPTAFEGSAGESGPVVAVLCEYDALPGVGHACGHNIIATAGLGAGLAAAAVAGDAGGRLRILGTPAEEGGGGKVRMARAGAFEGIDAAMMVHPADADLVAITSLAIQELQVTFHGLAAHAAAAPWDGRNALDAAVLGYTSIAALRQHIRPNERIHGVFIEGGAKANIVPDRTSMSWYVRSGSIGMLQDLKQRVLTCLESAAAATGCTLDVEWIDNTYAEMVDNQAMVEAYVANAARLGRTVRDPVTSGKHVAGSTDMGNVSYLVPSIHPMIQAAPEGVPIHSVDFASYAASPQGDQAVLDGAKAMAMTIVDLWASAALRDSAQEEFGRRPQGVAVI
jgi:amidohydrolase